jgi:hypothetical protein
MTLQFICAEIERLHRQIRRRQKEVFSLQRSGIVGGVAGADAGVCGCVVHKARQIGSPTAHRATLHEQQRFDSLK